MIKKITVTFDTSVREALEKRKGSLRDSPAMRCALRWITEIQMLPVLWGAYTPPSWMTNSRESGEAALECLFIPSGMVLAEVHERFVEAFKQSHRIKVTVRCTHGKVGLVPKGSILVKVRWFRKGKGPEFNYLNFCVPPKESHAQHLMDSFGGNGLP